MMAAYEPGDALDERIVELGRPHGVEPCQAFPSVRWTPAAIRSNQATQPWAQITGVTVMRWAVDSSPSASWTVGASPYTWTTTQVCRTRRRLGEGGHDAATHPALRARLPQEVGSSAALLAVICHSGVRSQQGARMLRGHSIEAASVSGGMLAWTRAGYPTTMED
jgi:rhodanese-related sulfurtransferase